ncbi:zinc finger protein ZXDC [Hippocampus zosterae]|uniref:zinc finger protein ZXDC n=1 Tax=Hippocampus zosterae TaxID=109293 RepID=UPI00223CEDD5|nr:zinc finger protein ZXDC [Hippocampus zosterae]
MEIQGLSDAQNIQSQHGAPRSDLSSGLGPVSGSIFRFPSPQNEADLQLESSECGNQNSRPRTYPLLLLAENGREVGLSPVNKPQLGDKTNMLEDIQNGELRNVNTTEEERENPGCTSNSADRRTGAENADSPLQMALLRPGGEEEPTLEQQLTLPFPALRHQRGNGASQQPSLTSHNLTGVDKITSKESKNNAKELYLVFNVIQDDTNFEGNKHQLDSSSKMLDKMKRRGRECLQATSCETMDFANASNVLHCCSNVQQDRSDTLDSKKTETVKNFENGSSTKVGTKQTDYYRTVEDVVLTNKYGEKICGQICTENSEGKALRELSLQARNDGLISTNLDIVETIEASQLILDSAALDNNAKSSSHPPGQDANASFSGTIMINNQTVIVTIENGTLTLAAQSDGYVPKQDDLVTLKEHLGMKSHEDIVLLNYDSGTKAIGKISTLAVTNLQEEARPGSSICDSEISLLDNISLPPLSTSVHSCPIVKHEAGAQHEITEADLVTSSPQPSITNKGSKCGPLFRPNKVIAVSFACPEMGCSYTFDTRQKLKVHLLNHAEDPRPYQCTVEGCGWAFATSYKLKRHLQSHNKQRPHTCHFEGCGRCFTTVYNLKAHTKVHDQDDAFVCEVCNERFRSATRLGNHQRVHFEPQRPHKCEFPGCEKTFITFSALYSHNRTHFREMGHFTCTYPGCAKMYDKACRLKIHLRSHTGERPFVCDSDGCGWSFTSMSKLLRHKRKHDDDRRFICTEEGCGKSFTRAEHLKGHSITHLGTKPFQCHAEGCNAKFSARSSLYIHTKKHKQDTSTLRTRCPVSNCSKHFSSPSTLKSHMLKQHQLSPDVMNQMETTPTLTPSSELISPTPVTVSGSSIAGSDQLTNLDLSSLFSNVSGTTTSPVGIGVGVPVGGSNSNSSGTFTMDLSLVSSGILTFDPTSSGTALCTSNSTSVARPVDPLILAPGIEMGPHHSLGGTVGDVLPPQGTLNLDDVQSITPEALGALASLSMQGHSSLNDPTLHHPLVSSGALGVEPAASLAVAPVSELLPSPAKMEEVGGQGVAGTLSCVEVPGSQDGGQVLTQFVFPGRSSSLSLPKDIEINAVSHSSFSNSGSARTDYRAIQLAKKRKQICPIVSGISGATPRKAKGAKSTPSNARYNEVAAASYGSLNLRDSITGAQFVQIQLLQDNSSSDNDLAFQLSSQPSPSHSQLTVDLPVNILQETTVSTEENSGSDDSQFTGSTINLQDLE